MDLQTIEAGKLIGVIDSSCGSFTFDLNTLKWYKTQPGVDSALIGGHQTPKSVQTPAPRSGAVTLATAAPAAYMGSCYRA